MKKTVTFAVLFSILVFSACKNKSNATADQESSQPSSSASDSKPSAANEPEELKLVATPDSAVLGKQKEALVKIIDGKAVTLQDPDGKNHGSELTINLNVTNRNTIGNGNVSISYADSRLQLDNGTNITCKTGTDFLGAAPEATSKTESWTYEIPAGTKPVALNLFMDQTRVSVKVELK